MMNHQAGYECLAEELTARGLDVEAVKARRGAETRGTAVLSGSAIQ